MAKKTTTKETSTKKTKKTKKSKEVIQDEVTPVSATEETSEETKKSAVAEEVKEKLEDVATNLIEKAQDAKHPWYAKVMLYIAALILGGLAFLFANFGESIMVLIENLLNGLAQ